MAEYQGIVTINGIDFPILDGTISYKNGYQYVVNIRMPRYAIDYEQHNTLTIKITDGTNTFYYDGIIDRVKLDDIMNITASDPTKKLDYAYYEWIDLANNMQSSTIPYSDGQINITQYVKKTIIDNYIAPFLTRPVTYIDEWVTVDLDTFKGFVMGIAQDIIKNPQLSNILTLLSKFGVTMIYDGSQYTVIGAKTLWDRYTSFPTFTETDPDVIAIGVAEIDFTKKYDQIIVKNSIADTQEFIAKYPPTIDIPNPRVKVVPINTPLFDKTLLQRIANVVYLDYYMQFAREQIILNAPNRINVWNNVTIRIQQGYVFWKFNIPIVPDWADESGVVWSGMGMDFVLEVGSSMGVEKIFIGVGQGFASEVGATIGAEDASESALNVSLPFFLSVGATIGAKVFF